MTRKIIIPERIVYEGNVTDTMPYIKSINEFYVVTYDNIEGKMLDKNELMKYRGRIYAYNCNFWIAGYYKRRSGKKGSSLHSKGKLKELRKLYKLEQWTGSIKVDSKKRGSFCIYAGVIDTPFVYHKQKKVLMICLNNYIINVSSLNLILHLHLK